MSRPTIQHLLDRLRLWIADPSGAAAQLGDVELAAYLDDNRTDVYNHPLEAVTTDVVQADVGWWEDTAVVNGPDGSVVEPASRDLMRGSWVLPPGTGVVTVTGSWFDGHGAAADALQHLVAQLRAGQVTSWSDGQVTVRRSETISGLQDLIRDHRNRSGNPGGRVRVIRARRTDMVPAR